MLHEQALIATLAVGLALAFAFGLLVVRLRLSPIVAICSPASPSARIPPGGWPTRTSPRSCRDCRDAADVWHRHAFLIARAAGGQVHRDAGRTAQIMVATALGAPAAWLWGWTPGAGLLSAWRCRWRAPRCCAGARHHRHRQRAGGVRAGGAAASSSGHGAQRRRSSGPDRRVPLHPRGNGGQHELAATAGQSYIVAGAVLSITVNPLVFTLLRLPRAARGARGA